MWSWIRALAGRRALRRAVVLLYIVSSGAVVLQRGIIGPQHNVFKIFRQSFWHLESGQNLYAVYPTEQGDAESDLFKYSPTAALFFGPFAVPPYALALFAWSLLGALLLFRGLSLVLDPNRAVLAALLVYPDLFASLQACSSNAQIAALIIVGYVALERGHQVRSAMAIVAGAAMKIFPLAALTFALFHSRRRRLALIVIGVAVVALMLPLVLTSPARLVQQYRWWFAIERNDAADLVFGLSVMRLLRAWLGTNWPSWPLQVIGTAALLLPLAMRRERWRDPEFRVGFLVSLLAYAVLFNHQAERSSFVIASAGVAIWCVSPPRGTTLVWLRALVGVSALVGLRTVPLLAVWLLMQGELYGWRARRRRAHEHRINERLEERVAANVAALTRAGVAAAPSCEVRPLSVRSVAS